MSILVAVASPEGLALAVDSRTTQTRGAHHRVSSETAQKVFPIESGAAIATYGMAMIGESTIRGLVDDFAEELTPAPLEESAEALGTYFQAKLDAVTPSPRGDYKLPAGWPLGFVVGGYDDAGVGRLLDVRVRPLGHEVQDIEVSTSNPGVTYRGQTSAIERLLEGLDWPAIRRGRIDVPDPTRQQLQLLRYDLILPQTVADAVGFARFLIQTAIGMQQFSDGTYLKPSEIPGCGGPIRVVTVTRGGSELLGPV